MRQTSQKKSQTNHGHQNSHTYGMSRAEYFDQRNIVKNQQIPNNKTNYPDQENAKSQSPGIKLKSSKVNNSLRDSQNFEQLYIQEQQSKKMLQSDKENLERSLQKMIENKKQMEKEYEEYLSIIQQEKKKYEKYEKMYQQAENDKRQLEIDLNKLKNELNIAQQNEGQNEIVENLKNKIRRLNDEKMNLINDLESQKVQINNLRTEVNHIQSSSRGQNGNLERELEQAKQRIETLTQELERQKNQPISQIDNKNERIKYLEERLDKLMNTLQKSSENMKCRDCESNNITINFLNDRVQELSTPVKTYVTRAYSPLQVVEEPIYTSPTYISRAYTSPIRTSYVEKIHSPSPIRTNYYSSYSTTYEPRFTRKSITYETSPIRRYVDNRIERETQYKSVYDYPEKKTRGSIIIETDVDVDVFKNGREGKFNMYYQEIQNYN